MKNTIKTCCLNLLLGILILAGCSNPALEQTETSAQTGAVSVRIGTIEGQFENAARTLAPVSSAFSKYVLTFEGPTETEHPSETISSASASKTIELPVGNWTITARAYNKKTNPDIVAMGSATISVSTGANAPANIILTQISEGEGTFEYSIHVPRGATGKLVIVPTADEEQEDEEQEDEEQEGEEQEGEEQEDIFIEVELGLGGTLNDTGSIPLPSGQYLMSVRLTDLSSGKSVGRTEAVHIYSDMITPVEYSFSEYDFQVVFVLPIDDWKRGEITESSGDVYSFTASQGSTYQVQWNTSDHGDGTYTLSNAKVSAFKDDGTLIFSKISDGWTRPSTVSDVTGLVYLKVEGNTGGTYAIRYYDPTLLPPQTSMKISEVSNPADPVPVPSYVIKWNYVNDVTGYHLYRSANPKPAISDVAAYLPIGGDITGISYTDTDVSADVTYYYKVAAYNANGDGARSPAVSGTLFTPTVITSLSAGVEQTKAFVANDLAHWYSFEASEGSTYKVELKYNDATYSLSYASLLAYRADGSRIYSYTSPLTVSDVTGTVYLKVDPAGSTGTYAIKYYDSTLQPPQTPTYISVAPNPVPSNVISWGYVQDATGYHLYRSANPKPATSDDAAYLPIGGDITETFSYTDTDVSADVIYYYKVAAYNANGEGEKSSNASGTVPTVKALSYNIWQNGNIETFGDVKWYSFEAKEGSTYQVQLKTSQDDMAYTLSYADVLAYNADGSHIYSYTSPLTVSGVTGTVYLQVQGYNSGTYAICYYMQ